VWREVLSCHFHLVDLLADPLQFSLISDPVRHLQQAEEPPDKFRVRLVSPHLKKRRPPISCYCAVGALGQSELRGQAEAAGITKAQLR